MQLSRHLKERSCPLCGPPDRGQVRYPANFDEARFRTMVRTLFGMRRKTIRNNLKSLVSSEQLQAMESGDAKRFLDLRAEALTAQDFLALHQTIVS